MVRKQRLLLSWAIAFATASIPAIAEDSVVEPQLVVWAKTELANQGKPTIDLPDLERYFVRQLGLHRFDHVYPSATSKLLAIPGDDVYLLELSVDAFQTASRAMRDAYGTYHDAPVLNIELSVRVKHARTSRSLGSPLVSDEYPLDNLDDVPEKRAALYTTADHLAEFFANEVSQGKLGDQMKSAQRSLATELWSHVEPWHIAVGIAALVLIVLFVAAASSSNYLPERASPPPANAEPPRPPKRRPEWDERLKETLAMALETSGFSEVSSRTCAQAKLEEVLQNAAEIENAEAERRLHLKDRHAEYDKVAAYGAQRSFLDERSLWEILSKADEWPYLVLQEAKKIKEELD